MIAWLLSLCGLLVLWFLSFFLPYCLQKRQAVRISAAAASLASPVANQLVIQIYCEEQKPS
jgi:hypothetical protein